MSYEEGKGLYYKAAATASAAALLIRRPWAFYIVAMIGLMISDPGRMSGSSKTWRTTDNGGTTSELAALEEQLKQLQATVTGTGTTWEGTAREKFDEAYAEFTKSLATLRSTRNATGEAVDQSAKLYHVGALTCVCVAGYLALYAMTLLALRHSVYGNFIAYALDLKVSRTTTTSMKKVLIKHGIAVTILGTLFYQAVQVSESSGKMFPTMKGIPNELDTLKSGDLPEFSNTALEYSVESHSLMPKLDTQGGLPRT
ncbi:WXG100 family type VII secretion target [Nonomuraea sp. NPDC003560]|uniref:WXG100 family type VII secretion target n=1 Tax=Nonomuraea sp. NPDC003560 TaxID=3364341 RepID=UPI00367CD2CD